MIGKTMSHYRILEKLGSGGMGVVYKARDEHLDRFAALKLLPPERLTDPERRLRFVQEAKAASALNHPNIIHIYDVTESEGTLFLAMEYVPGRTLGQLIGLKGLPLNDALKYAAQIADGLAKTHSAGIVHRDLKPSNIVVTDDGLIKVLDFGLAKLTEAAGGELAETRSTRHVEAPRTEEGVIVGTAAYMSPEQAEGNPWIAGQTFSPSGRCCTKCCRAGGLSTARATWRRWYKFCIRSPYPCMKSRREFRPSWKS
jgi:serine/threonine protein kinase